MSATDIDDKTRADLGWQQLLDGLAARCHTDRGARAAQAIELSIDVGFVRARLSEITEARDLHDRAEPMPFGRITDVEEALERASKGGHLDGPSLRAIAAVAVAGRILRKHLTTRAVRAPRLAGRASVLHPLDDVSGPIDDSFDDASVLLDRASPALGGLRRRLAALHEELSRRSRELLDDTGIAPHLQDRFYTQRDERYVLPIRADALHKVRGIVHGRSRGGVGQTVFVEPEEMVDLNNRLKLAELEVADEERRILGELTLLVKDAVEPLRENLTVLEALDLIDAGARLAADMSAREPTIVVPGDTNVQIDIRNARHPLMVLSGVPCVASDIVIAHGGTLVVSGPNAGGKTVALKTVGLMVLMARAGLHIPAQEGSSLPLFARVLTDVGDDQSLERNLSTFSAHVMHLNQFLEAAGPSTLILLDEVAVGTDPEQGAALAQAVLEQLAERGATVVVTTHYDRLKALGARDPRFANASVGFDLERLAPTFKLHLGVPGASGAIVVAKRLGLPLAIARRAEELLGSREKGIEDLLRQVDGERRRLAAAVEKADAERRIAEHERQRAELLAQDATERLRDARKGAHDEAVAALQRARMDFDRVRGQLKVASRDIATADAAKEVRHASNQSLATAGRALDAAAEVVRTHAPKSEAAQGRALESSDLTIGAEVFVLKLNGRGTVLALPSPGKAQVQVGALKLVVPVEELRAPTVGSKKATGGDLRTKAEKLAARLTLAEQHAPRAASTTGARTLGNTLDVRGERVEEAVNLVEKYLDDALRSGQDAFYIVHGVGTGALRSALREHLTSYPGVSSVRGGDAGEGGDGVTVVSLG